MKITITMILPKESRTASLGRCSHINVTHWHSTRLTGDKTKTNVTDCHDDDAYTVTDKDGAALSDSDIDALTFIKEFTYLRQSPSHGVLTYTPNSTQPVLLYLSQCPSSPARLLPSVLDFCTRCGCDHKQFSVSLDILTEKGLYCKC